MNTTEIIRILGYNHYVEISLDVDFKFDLINFFQVVHEMIPESFRTSHEMFR